MNFTVKTTNKKTTEVLADVVPQMPRKAVLLSVYSHAFEFNKAKAVLSMLCKSGHQFAKKDRALKEECREDE